MNILLQGKIATQLGWTAMELEVFIIIERMGILKRQVLITNFLILELRTC